MYTMKKGKDMAKEEQETAAIEPLSPVSQLFVSPSLYCFIIFTLGFQTRCNPSTIVEGVKNTWIKLPRFSSKVEIKKNGKASWVPVSVRVEDHVVVPDLDYSNIENPDQFIEDYTSKLANTPMDMSRPLWELHLLNIKTSNAESLAIGKFHHSLGDGMSLISLLLASSRKTSDPDALPTTAATRKHASSNKKSWWLVGRFWFMIRIIFTTVVELFKYLLTLCFMRDTKTPLMGKTGDAIRSRKVIHRIVSFDDVKLVKNNMDMKVNDVLLGMTQAGLSRYLSRKYDEDMVVEKKKNLEKIRLRGTVFVNLRADTKLEDLANMMAKGSKCRWGNFVGVIIFPLWVRSEDDPLEYVRRAKSTMDIKKLSIESLICYGLIKLTRKILGGKVVETLVRRLFDHTTLTFSNVMGPDEDISFFDHPMSYVAASALGGPQALIIHYVTYVNKIVINLAVDTSVIRDPHLLCDDLVESLDIIKLAAMEKGVHKMEV
ncbi:O-acyltransferase (WSD1-like) family protein [Arabidopsis thaliana]|uniref:Wax ester synthase/diacylglycerol acyltransferase 3 n=1 Tax=Arabidopsis thaliana TaxID=3702 RepID=WSD3_ARATH|nr:O-acyltransferase (WSD1-like) family protein [Arabidopsis thaliana]F4IU14.1 RecName: Full=Wax ester synthase/diacylglycerol acyltransferase 3; Short=WS/DGAT 3; AltName: Full=Diacylglycerol O-acyltransferase WSD3; AltName: Full=Long-chain-alcohol O-fatty-acyltransferase WSD3 [Arabidopsis thaliana]AEC09622.1 O-acyltransferase (WSD1-like) family protein [Arabidopsis thaliana]|eukprot:NP_001189709.1 O-acyltransferase (WSD1-like) family protein [Arabidopsis thaliana]